MTKRPARTKTRNFKFRKHATIGAADAFEDKKQFLMDCFVDTGELGILADTTKPDCIVLGRTGSGKTALLEMLCENCSKVIQISPESLALTYLSNDGALKFFMEVGIDLELFFRVLWRHVFAVEIIRAHFDITNEAKALTFFEKLRTHVFKKKSKEKARDYLLHWGESFWKETDYRVREYTQTLEHDIKVAASATLEAAIPGIGGGQVS